MANFSINDNPLWVQFTASGGQTQFNLPFPFINNADIFVWQDGTLLALTTDYTLSGANTSSGGLVTLVVAASANDILTMVNRITPDRTSIYIPVISNLTGNALNNDFNRDVLMISRAITTLDYMMLQYQPYADISQDISVTRDRIIPVLDPNAAWVMNPGGTEIVSFELPTTVVGVNGNFTLDNAITRVDLSSGTNYIQESTITLSDANVIQSVGTDLTLTAAVDLNLNASGAIDISSGSTLSLNNIVWPTSGASQLKGLRLQALSSTQLEWATFLALTGSGVDNSVIRFDGTLGAVQSSAEFIDDAGNSTGLASIAVQNVSITGNTVSSSSGNLTISATSGHQLVPNDPTLALGIATKQYVDATAAGFIHDYDIALWVDLVGGSDANDGLSIEKPLLTIQYALDLADASATNSANIYVVNGGGIANAEALTTSATLTCQLFAHGVVFNGAFINNGYSTIYCIGLANYTENEWSTLYVRDTATVVINTGGTINQFGGSISGTADIGSTCYFTGFDCSLTTDGTLKSSSNLLTLDLTANGIAEVTATSGTIDNAGAVVGSIPYCVINTNTGTLEGSLNGITFGSNGYAGTADLAAAYTLPTTDGSASDVLTTDGAGVVSFQPLPASGMSWVDVIAGTQTIAASTGYITDFGATLVTYTLPATAAIGDVFEVVGYSTGLWIIEQVAGQSILFGNTSTTVGVTGSIAATLQNDCVRLVCVATDTKFTVVSSIGNITIV